MLAHLTYFCYARVGPEGKAIHVTVPRDWLDAWLMIRRRGGLNKAACKCISDGISPRGMSSLTTVCHSQNIACAWFSYHCIKLTCISTELWCLTWTNADWLSIMGREAPGDIKPWSIQMWTDCQLNPYEQIFVNLNRNKNLDWNHV